MENIRVFSSKRDYWRASLKEHWIIWTSVSTFIAIASFLKIDATQSIAGWMFYLLLFCTFAYVTLSSVALSSAVKAVKSFVHKKDYSPSFQNISHVSLIEGTNNYRMVAMPPAGIRVPLNTLVCVYKKDTYEQIIGLGKLTKENQDGSVEIAVSTSESGKNVCSELVQGNGVENIIITVLVPKEVIPDIDGYLNSENIAIQQLLKSEDLDNDGGDIKI
ncbi:hypothetical protein [uncultured Vibrio sp.]|uniref:hypothetical protein n=1 Tax=uncultured Vibrio sp. TaxID=114054 RepID=UPI002AAB2B8D|nr:hypothetical protein [uncultured Vibrio sp.]